MISSSTTAAIWSTTCSSWACAGAARPVASSKINGSARKRRVGMVRSVGSKKRSRRQKTNVGEHVKCRKAYAVLCDYGLNGFRLIGLQVAVVRRTTATYMDVFCASLFSTCFLISHAVVSGAIRGMRRLRKTYCITRKKQFLMLTFCLLTGRSESRRQTREHPDVTLHYGEGEAGRSEISSASRATASLRSRCTRRA